MKCKDLRQFVVRKNEEFARDNQDWYVDLHHYHEAKRKYLRYELRKFRIKENAS